MSRRCSPPLLPVPLLEAQRVRDRGVVGEPQLLGEGRSHVGQVLLLGHDQNLQGHHLVTSFTTSLPPSYTSLPLFKYLLTPFYICPPSPTLPGKQTTTVITVTDLGTRVSGTDGAGGGERCGASSNQKVGGVAWQHR